MLNSSESVKVTGHLLVVDDTPDNVRLLSKMLTLQGYQVRGTISGRIALQSARREPPDLILLDILMPEMDGYEVCRQLKSDAGTCHIPVIFISALEEASDKVKAFEAGGVDYITKPFQAQEVLARIKHQLTIQQQRQQLVNQNQQLAIALHQAQLYQVAQAQVEELARLNRLKDDFLSSMSHELRTPISNVQMATQMLALLLERVKLEDVDRAQVVQWLKIVQDECNREIDLVNDILDLSHLDAETEPLTLTTLDLTTWIPHLAESFEIRIRNQHQTLKIQLPPDLPALTTDFTDLERILVELLDNACKYTPPGGTIAITAQRLGPEGLGDRRTQPPSFNSSLAPSDGPPLGQPYLLLCVSNFGVEIPLVEHDRIFDKFYRIPNDDPWKYEGTGLGLALVKKRVQRLAGTIDVSSAEGKTTFSLKLPLTRIASKVESRFGMTDHQS